MKHLGLYNKLKCSFAIALKLFPELKGFSWIISFKYLQVFFAEICARASFNISVKAQNSGFWHLLHSCFYTHALKKSFLNFQFMNLVATDKTVFNSSILVEAFKPVCWRGRNRSNNRLNWSPTGVKCSWTYRFVLFLATRGGYRIEVRGGARFLGTKNSYLGTKNRATGNIFLT